MMIANDSPRAGRRAHMASQEVGFGTELCAFLQSRLALVTAFLGLVGAVLFVVSRAADMANHGWVGGNWTHPSVVIHAVGTLLAIPIYLFLKGRTLSASALRWSDALIAEAVIACCLLMYAFSYRTGIRQLVGILGLLLIARAIVIPSRARRTFLLSLPAPLGVLAIQLLHGRVYTLDGEIWPQAGFTAYVLWDQATLLTAMGLATATSYVLYGLRVRAFEAAQIGRYTLEKRIGGGAIGEVFVARHAHIRRPVAVKILRPEIAGERNLELFEKEVQRTSELTHPNTVSIFDFGLTADGLFYYAMEYLDGVDLDCVVDVDGPMPPARVIHVLQQACGALAEAHQTGLIHCDIKPANLVLCRQGGRPDVVKVLDFGLARNVARRREAEGDGKAYGTPLTMAPEVIRGKRIDAATDLYSLGAVGYYLATGRPVFGGETVGEVLVQHLKGKPIPLSERIPGFPSDLEACILRCLEKKAGDRYPSASVLSAALECCADATKWSVAEAEAWWEEHREALLAKRCRDPDAPSLSSSIPSVGVTTLT